MHRPSAQVMVIRLWRSPRTTAATGGRSRPQRTGPYYYKMFRPPFGGAFVAAARRKARESQ